MDNAIPVPKILPNKLKQIRQIRGLTLQEAAQKLDIHPFFLSSVENGKNNLSGKSTMNILHFFDISFEQLYDIKKTLTLDYVEEKTKKTTVEIILSEPEILSNSIKIEEKILEELLKKNINAQVYTYDIVKKQKTFKHGMFLCKINVELIVQEIVKKEFDINFFRDTNMKLTEILLERGFLEQPKNIKLDNNNFKVNNNKIYLSNKYKIKTNNNFIITNEIDINKLVNLDNNTYTSLDGSIKIFKNEKNEIDTISFVSLEEDMNNLRFIEDYLEKHEGFDTSKIPKLLGLSVPGYSNLVHGNQKISTKVMWRMVKLFRVPLEVILNTKRYINEIYEIN